MIIVPCFQMRKLSPQMKSPGQTYQTLVEQSSNPVHLLRKRVRGQGSRVSQVRRNVGRSHDADHLVPARCILKALLHFCCISLWNATAP